MSHALVAHRKQRVGVFRSRLVRLGSHVGNVRQLLDDTAQKVEQAVVRLHRERAVRKIGARQASAQLMSPCGAVGMVQDSIPRSPVTPRPAPSSAAPAIDRT
eukprot:2587869-Prymnesium_polylepis.6